MIVFCKKCNAKYRMPESRRGIRFRCKVCRAAVDTQDGMAEPPPPAPPAPEVLAKEPPKAPPSPPTGRPPSPPSPLVTERKAEAPRPAPPEHEPSRPRRETIVITRPEEELEIEPSISKEKEVPVRQAPSVVAKPPEEISVQKEEVEKPPEEEVEAVAVEEEERKAVETEVGGKAEGVFAEEAIEEEEAAPPQERREAEEEREEIEEAAEKPLQEKAVAVTPEPSPSDVVDIAAAEELEVEVVRAGPRIFLDASELRFYAENEINPKELLVAELLDETTLRPLPRPAVQPFVTEPPPLASPFEGVEPPEAIFDETALIFYREGEVEGEILATEPLRPRPGVDRSIKAYCISCHARYRLPFSYAMRTRLKCALCYGDISVIGTQGRYPVPPRIRMEGRKELGVSPQKLSVLGVPLDQIPVAEEVEEIGGEELLDPAELEEVS